MPEKEEEKRSGRAGERGGERVLFLIFYVLLAEQGHLRTGRGEGEEVDRRILLRPTLSLKA